MQEQLDQLEDLLGFDLLASLLGISKKNLIRYDADQDTVPEIVQQRVCFLNQMVKILSGAYNDTGIRQWFLRKRVELENKSPTEILKGEWDPESPEPKKVLALARAVNR